MVLSDMEMLALRGLYPLFEKNRCCRRCAVHLGVCSGRVADTSLQAPDVHVRATPECTLELSHPYAHALRVPMARQEAAAATAVARRLQASLQPASAHGMCVASLSLWLLVVMSWRLGALCSRRLLLCFLGCLGVLRGRSGGRCCRPPAAGRAAQPLCWLLYFMHNSQF